MKISFNLNGKPVSLDVDGQRPLLWVLRSNLGLTGTKFGCGEGHCGSCTVLLDKVAVRSCLLKAKDAADKALVTIEGLAANGKLHPLQRAFIAHDAMQCGYCTPGMLLTACALLAANPTPSRPEIIRALDQNLCRCGAHTRILDAVQSAAAQLKGAQPL